MVDLASNAFGGLAVRDEVDRLREEVACLRRINDELRLENGDLRLENARLLGTRQELQKAVDVHVARAQTSRLFGPLELTAGTATGPWRSRSA